MSRSFHLPDVDCVVVNRDGGEALFSALRSLESQVGVDLSIVVVDNASDPAERQRLATETPEVRVVAFSRNLGFAGAVNEGIAHTRAPFVLLVNNDAVLGPDYVARLAARLELDGRLAAAQGMVLTADGSRIDTAGLEWNERGEAVPLLAGRDPLASPPAPFEVSGVSATATLYRREALEAVSSAGEILERSFFAYYEDVDLSLRLARAGWRFVNDPSAVARHRGSLTGNRTPLKRALWTCRNRWRTLFRNFDSRMLKRRMGLLLRADLAHARQLGWAGALLPLLIWPALPLLLWRGHPGGALLTEWPAIGSSPAPD